MQFIPKVSSNAVEVHIHHLRKKLGNGFIRTVHGVGYTLGDELADVAGPMTGENA